MKLLIILIAAFGLACSTANKNATDANAPKTTSDKKINTADAKTIADKDEEHHHHRHHKNTEEAKQMASADKGGGDAAKGVTCKSGTEERTIAVEKTDTGCSVNYTKAGKTDSVATGSSNMSHCNEVSEKMQKHLEDAGYTCK